MKRYALLRKLNKIIDNNQPIETKIEEPKKDISINILPQVVYKINTKLFKKTVEQNENYYNDLSNIIIYNLVPINRIHIIQKKYISETYIPINNTNDEIIPYYNQKYKIISPIHKISSTKIKLIEDRSKDVISNDIIVKPRELTKIDYLIKSFETPPPKIKWTKDNCQKIKCGFLCFLENENNLSFLIDNFKRQNHQNKILLVVADKQIEKNINSDNVFFFHLEWRKTIGKIVANLISYYHLDVIAFMSENNLYFEDYTTEQISELLNSSVLISGKSTIWIHNYGTNFLMSNSPLINNKREHENSYLNICNINTLMFHKKMGENIKGIHTGEDLVDYLLKHKNCIYLTSINNYVEIICDDSFIQNKEINHEVIFKICKYLYNDKKFNKINSKNVIIDKNNNYYLFGGTKIKLYKNEKVYAQNKFVCLSRSKIIENHIFQLENYHDYQYIDYDGYIIVANKNEVPSKIITFLDALNTNLFEL